LEEAEKRDHRKLGKQLDLFHFQDEAPGLVFWHPKGWTIWQQVEQYMRNKYQVNGYQEVKAPQILDASLWARPATGTTTAKTCSSPSRKTARTR
jgi:threonyl-tRNA synthetase